MSIRTLKTSVLVGAVALAAFAAPARAENVTKECAARYQAAKAANTLGGDTYLQFYSKCAAQMKAQGGAAANPPAAAPKPSAAAPAEHNGSIVFPTAVNPAYANEKPGKAILKTCVDQYKANKATGGNGGLKWIEKGGGYYSQCNKKLKGA